MVVRARTRSLAPARCTGCGTPSGWCHSRYVRRFGDTSLGGRPVLIELSVRRLYCENASCGKVTFAEQVPGKHRGAAVAAPRRTDVVTPSPEPGPRPSKARRPPVGGAPARPLPEGARPAPSRRLADLRPG
ncbi:transposase family protein [Streptomyces sp. NBC_00191]|uniref:transposase family protein n=1 Tax=Streptomyces sp. NBC_00191 TaxID=2975674 RepID=UPI00386A078E